MASNRSTFDVITCKIFSTSGPDAKLASVDDDGGLSGSTLVGGFANIGARPFTGCIICFSFDLPLCICGGMDDGGGRSFWFDIPLACCWNVTFFLC